MLKKVNVGSESGFLNCDLLDPDPAKNGLDPQPCFSYIFSYLARVGSDK